MGTPIPGLRGTPTHALAVVIYQGHHDDGSGFCARCGDPAPCGPRLHAASVIRAAGEDPPWYDRGLTRAAPTAELPDHAGYRVGGRGVPIDRAGSLYSREPD
jgi:hypothetical protein